MSTSVLYSHWDSTRGVFIRLQTRRLRVERDRHGVLKHFPNRLFSSAKKIPYRCRRIVSLSAADHTEPEEESSLVKKVGFRRRLSQDWDDPLTVSSLLLPEIWIDRISRWTAGDRRILNKYYKRIEKINALEPEMQSLSDSSLQEKTNEFRERSAAGESMEDLLVEAFAVVREAARRLLNMRHYDCQLVGGMVLHEGLIAEMETGEGKTLVATLPAYLNVCGGHRVHVITVNEYLADRDSKWMGTIYSFLGLTVTAVKEKMSVNEKKKAYKCDVVYVTAQKLCFDYLYDWSASDVNNLMLQELDFAIIDEVDSILIDESRIPMVLSEGTGDLDEKFYIAAEALYDLMDENNHGLINSLANKLDDIELLTKRGISVRIPITEIMLVRDSMVLLEQIIMETNLFPSNQVSQELLIRLRCDGNVESLKYPENFTQCVHLMLRYKPWFDNNKLYKIYVRQKHVVITEYGAQLMRAALKAKGERVLGDGAVSFWESDENSISWGPFLINAIKAYEFYKLGQQYIVMDGRITIVDEATGRTKEKCRWQESLHQSVEAKEKVYQDKRVRREGVDPSEPIVILPDDTATASITFQVFFRYYNKLSGMSGTALTEASEFKETFKLKVFHVPTHYPCQRIDQKPIVFYRKRDKVSEILKRLGQSHGIRPVLIGTNSVEESEALMESLKTTWIGPYNEVIWDGEQRFKRGKLLMLNARPEFVKDESRIIAQAGLPGMVTIATRMAGRGTDILLGGNSRGLVENALYTSVFRKCLPKLKVGQQFSLPEFDLSVENQQQTPSSISGLVTVAIARAQTSEESIFTLDDLENLMNRVMSITQGLRSEVLHRLKHSSGSSGLQDLDFETHIRLATSQVWTEKESELEKETPFVQALARCALYTWLWFDQKCEAYAKTVREAGGLLVIGVSVAESKRIENQLRGRAGRQGDPGESVMLADVSDDMFREWQFESVRQVFEENSDVISNRLEGVLAELIINRTRSELENLHRSIRTQMANYDEIMEEIRQQCHFLKKTILAGSNEERNQLLYTWIQDMADALVESYTDPTRPISTWKLWRDDTERERSLEEDIDSIFNPEDRTCPFPVYNIRRQQLPSVQKTLVAGLTDAEGVEDSIRDACKVPLVRVIPFTTKMKEDINQALENRSLPRSCPSFHFLNRRRPLTLSIRQSLALHKKLMKERKQTKQTKGAFIDQVKMLQEYVGELMMMLFEERKRQIEKDLSREDGFVMKDADRKLLKAQKETMLSLLHEFWGSFLSYSTKLRTTTTLASLRGTPLEEFSIEAHREFASMLLLYRQAVVMHVVAPQVYMGTDDQFKVWMDLMDSVPDNKGSKTSLRQKIDLKWQDLETFESENSSETLDAPGASPSTQL